MERNAGQLRRSEDTQLGLALPQVEHRELRYFVAVAEELHFTNAAQRLDMAQPPLSAAIAHLEAKLGTRLFERDSRNVRLTPAGLVLLQRARPILRQVDDAVDAARRSELGWSPTVRVVTDGVSRVSTVPALRLALERAGQKADVSVTEVLPAAIPDAIRTGEADVGVYIGNDHEPGLTMQRVRSVAPVAVFAASHPLARRKRVRLDELVEHRLAIWPEEQAPASFRLVLSLFDGLELQQGLVVVPMFSGIWDEELRAGAFCVLPADAPIVNAYTASAISGVSSTFDTWVAWSASQPPPGLDTIRAAAAALAPA